MKQTIYSHAFLVGCFNGDIKPQDLNAEIWSRQTLTIKEYTELQSDYYKSLVDSMVEAQNQTRPDFLQPVCHYSVDVDSKCEHAISICLTKGRAEIPYDYKLFLCKLHLYFFPLNIVLFALEIDEREVDLNLMTLGHGSLINLKFGETGNEELYQKMKPLLDLVSDHEIKYIVKDGNNMKIFQIVEVEGNEPEDNMLFEIGTFIPIGAVGGKDGYSPSMKYFTQIINDNSISVFYNWKALALVDSFTVLGVDDYYKWTWENLYFPLIYIRCIYEKTFCFSRNSAYRLGKAVENLSNEIADMEKYYFYNNISYNFLPEMLYDFMVRGIGLKEEREEISEQIKERAKEEEARIKEQKETDARIQKDKQSLLEKQQEEQERQKEKRFNSVLSYAAIFAVFSVAWDLCSMLKDALSISEDHKYVIAWIFIGIAFVFIGMLIYMIKNNLEIVDLLRIITKRNTNRIIIPLVVREHLATHFQQDLPGSKFYSESPEDLLEEAMRLFPNTFREAKSEDDGRIRISLTFPRVIGLSKVVSIDELTEEEKKRIEIIDRNGKKVRSVKTDRIIPTHECQIILSSDWQLITMFPGEMAPPLPDSTDIHDEYWDNHVFIEPVEPNK